MKILHYNPHIDSMITQYVTMLANAMPEHVGVFIATSLAQFCKLISGERPDIVHLHGCWNFSIAAAEYIGKKYGARIVVSPHGQLEPWIVHNRYFTYRLPRLIAYQRRIIADAYAIIAMGNMELRCIRQFTGNPRLEKVLNALITQKISDREMACQIADIYQKVLDSDTLQLMDDRTRDVLSSVIKLGITGDIRWIDRSSQNALRENISDAQWRKVLLYACHEDILPVVTAGLSVAGLTETLPDIDVEAIPHYLPKQYKPTVKSMPETAGDATEQAFVMVKRLYKEASHNRLAISHIIQLHQLLFDQEVDEDKLSEELSYSGIDKFASRLMQIMRDKTLLEEGYMVRQPINDRTTRRMMKKMENRLKI